MDHIDEKIIEMLEKDSRMPFLQIAKDLNVSEGTIRKRVAALKNQSIILQFTIKRQINTTAIVGVVTNPHVPTKQIIASLKKLKTRKIYEVTGRYDLMCTISALNMVETNEILEMIRATPGVEQTETFTVLKEN